MTSSAGDIADDPRRRRVLSGGLRSTVLWLALPVLLEQFLSFLVGFYDTYLSGRISAEATSAIGLAAYVSWLASMMFGLVGTGTTALVSRGWGAGDRAEAERVANRSLALGASMGGLLYAFIFFAAPWLADLLNMQGEGRRIAVRYLRIDGFGHLFTGVALVGAAAMRGAGDMRSPMIVLGLVSVLNVIVSTLLVYGVGPLPAIGFDRAVLDPLGVDGIVLGTIVARFCGGALMIFGFARGWSGLKLRRRELRVRGNTARRILRIGGPAAIDGMVMWAGQFVFLMIIAQLSHGSDTDSMNSAIFAAHIIGIRVEAISYLPAVAWGCAAATVVGQSLGAGDRERAVKAGHEATLQCGLLGVAITAVFFFGAETIYSLMHDDPEVVAVGTPAFRFLAFFQVPLIISITYVFALRAAGDTRYPLWATAIGVLAFRVPLAWLCGVKLGGGLFGAWIGMNVDVAVRAVIVWSRFAFGRWWSIEV